MMEIMIKIYNVWCSGGECSIQRGEETRVKRHKFGAYKTVYIVFH